MNNAVTADKIRVVIDPGHGGNDRYNRGPTGYIEPDGVLKISKYLREALLTTGMIDVVMTRDKDMTLGLVERGQMGSGSDIFISEHTNAFNAKTSGVEVFYSVDIPGDKPFAEMLSAAVASAMGIPNKGAKTRESQKYPGEDYYTVIDQAQDSGAKHVFLIESGYHDNPSDEAILKVDANLKKIALAQAQVLSNVIGVQYPAATPKTPEEEFAENMAYISDTVGLGKAYWLQQAKINPYFPELIKKVSAYIKDLKKLIPPQK